MQLDRLELKVPPLALTMLAALLTVGVQMTLPEQRLLPTILVRVGGACVAFGGLWVALMGVVAFRNAQTTVDPLHPDQARRLVAAGVYRRTRNPMYLGFVLMLIGLAVALQSAVGLTIAGLTAVLLQRLQIIPEERILRQRFGEEFAAYCRRVRRWL
jgi:protein-S-isoprenylcysteine O-methyltransferase Ste14